MVPSVGSVGRCAIDENGRPYDTVLSAHQEGKLVKNEKGTSLATEVEAARCEAIPAADVWGRAFAAEPPRSGRGQCAGTPLVNGRRPEEGPPLRDAGARGGGHAGAGPRRKAGGSLTARRMRSGGSRRSRRWSLLEARAPTLSRGGRS